MFALCGGRQRSTGQHKSEGQALLNRWELAVSPPLLCCSHLWLKDSCYTQPSQSSCSWLCEMILSHTDRRNWIQIISWHFVIRKYYSPRLFNVRLKASDLENLPETDQTVILFDLFDAISNSGGTAANPNGLIWQANEKTSNENEKEASVFILVGGKYCECKQLRKWTAGCLNWCHNLKHIAHVKL